MSNQKIEELLKECKLRPTSNIILIYKTLLEVSHPVSLAELEDKLYPVDRSSIFRTLTIFAELSLVHSIEDGSGSTKYELCRRPGQCSPEEQHLHFYCEKCNRVFCDESQKVPHITLPQGFTALSMNFTVRGVCAECGLKHNVI